jgi:hypothetical protein
MFGFGFLFALIGRRAAREGAGFSPSLDFSDGRNSNYLILIF